MKDDLLNVFLVKGYAFVGLMLGNIFMFPELSLELGILGSVGQFIMILATYVYMTKNNKKRNVPSLFYAATAVLAFFLSLFLSDPLHDWLHSHSFLGIKFNPSTTTVALLLGAISEYTYEIINLVMTQVKGIIPELGKWAAKKLGKDGKED